MDSGNSSYSEGFRQKIIQKGRETTTTVIVGKRKESKFHEHYCYNILILDSGSNMR